MPRALPLRAARAGNINQHNGKSIVRLPMLKVKNELNPRQQMFIREYINNCGNAYRAYIACYPSVKNRAVADVNASRMLRNAKIKEAIEALYAKFWKEKDTELEKSKTFQMIHAIGCTNIADVVDLETGTLKVKDLSEIPPMALEAIQAIEYTEKNTEHGTDKNIKVKLHPKLQALELRAKIQKIISDNIEAGDIVIVPAIRPNRLDRPKKED